MGGAIGCLCRAWALGAERCLSLELSGAALKVKVKDMGLRPIPHQGAALDLQGAMRPLTPVGARRWIH